MATCSEIDIQFAEASDQVSSALNKYNTVRYEIDQESYRERLAAATNNSLANPTFDTLDKLRNTTGTIEINAKLGLAKLDDLLIAATKAKCENLINRIQLESKIANGLIRGAKTQEARVEQLITNLSTRAATKQNNAGTGTPGTAGQGVEATPGASAPPTQIVTGASGATAPTAGVAEPKPVTPIVGATGAIGATSAVGVSAPKPVGGPPPPATKPVPSPQGKPGTAEYVSGLIKAEVVKAQNALATACSDKAKAKADVKKILANLGGSVAAAISTAKDADGKPLSQTARNTLSTELQGAISTVGKIPKDIDAKNCADTGATGATEGATGPVNTNTGVQPPNSDQTKKDISYFTAKKDWRVRLSLSPQSPAILYKDPFNLLLAPLQNTDGVLFPYTPAVSVAYNAAYSGDPQPVHSNYKTYMYTNSSVDQINITCDFTAQDTYEANYLLAVIHFFRSVTKMFYGQDNTVKPGTPPPLCYLSGFGQFQFDAHPLAITNFTYNLPNEVDYIRAGDLIKPAGVNRGADSTAEKPAPSFWESVGDSLQNTRLGQGISRIGDLIDGKLTAGGNLSSVTFTDRYITGSTALSGISEPTYVPTKITIQISCIPIVSRNDISKSFSFDEYANGNLLRAARRTRHLRSGGGGAGIW